MWYLTDTCRLTSSPGLLMKLQTKSGEDNKNPSSFFCVSQSKEGKNKPHKNKKANKLMQALLSQPILQISSVKTDPTSE